MKYYAYVDGQVVRELISIEDAQSLSSIYAPEYVAKCVVLTAKQFGEIKPGFIFNVSNEFKEPPPVPQQAPLLRTLKSDVWRRCTDAEAVAADAALKAAPVKQQRLWSDSTILEHESPEFHLVRDFMVAEFGEARANEILAPS